MSTSLLTGKSSHELAGHRAWRLSPILDASLHPGEVPSGYLPQVANGARASLSRAGRSSLIEPDVLDPLIALPAVETVLAIIGATSEAAGLEAVYRYFGQQEADAAREAAAPITHNHVISTVRAELRDMLPEITKEAADAAFTAARTASEEVAESIAELFERVADLEQDVANIRGAENRNVSRKKLAEILRGVATDIDPTSLKIEPRTTSGQQLDLLVGSSPQTAKPPRNTETSSPSSPKKASNGPLPSAMPSHVASSVIPDAELPEVTVPLRSSGITSAVFTTTTPPAEDSGQDVDSSPGTADDSASPSESVEQSRADTDHGDAPAVPRKGRKPLEFSDDQILTALTMHEAGESRSAIAEALGVSHSAIGKYLPRWLNRVGDVAPNEDDTVEERPSDSKSKSSSKPKDPAEEAIKKYRLRGIDEAILKAFKGHPDWANADRIRALVNRFSKCDSGDIRPALTDLVDRGILAYEADTRRWRLEV